MFTLQSIEKFKVTNSHTPVGGANGYAYPKEFGAEVGIGLI